MHLLNAASAVLQWGGARVASQWPHKSGVKTIIESRLIQRAFISWQHSRTAYSPPCTSTPMSTPTHNANSPLSVVFYCAAVRCLAAWHHAAHASPHHHSAGSVVGECQLAPQGPLGVLHGGHLHVEGPRRAVDGVKHPPLPGRRVLHPGGGGVGELRPLGVADPWTSQHKRHGPRSALHAAVDALAQGQVPGQGLHVSLHLVAPGGEGAREGGREGGPEGRWEQKGVGVVKEWEIS